MTDLNVIPHAESHIDEPTKCTRTNLTSSEVEHRNIEEENAECIQHSPSLEEIRCKVVKHTNTTNTREGIRMNEAALKRERFIKNKLKR